MKPARSSSLHPFTGLHAPGAHAFFLHRSPPGQGRSLAQGFPATTPRVVGVELRLRSEDPRGRILPLLDRATSVGDSRAAHRARNSDHVRGGKIFPHSQSIMVPMSFCDRLGTTPACTVHAHVTVSDHLTLQGERSVFIYIQSSE